MLRRFVEGQQPVPVAFLRFTAATRRRRIVRQFPQGRMADDRNLVAGSEGGESVSPAMHEPHPELIFSATLETIADAFRGN